MKNSNFCVALPTEGQFALKSSLQSNIQTHKHAHLVIQALGHVACTASQPSHILDKSWATVQEDKTVTERVTSI